MTTTTMIIIYIIVTILNLIVQINCKCSLTPIVNGERSIAYACTDSELSDLDEISNEAEWIEFSVSRIRTIPDDAFSRFHGLKRLSFYNCHVDSISRNAFRGLQSLDWLIFHGTKLHVARTAWFQHLPNLRKLILDRCGIVYIEADVFRMLSRLEMLSLYDNELDCIPIDELTSLRSLRNIRIDGNPWLCECRRRLERFFHERRIFENVGIEEKIMPVHKSSRQCMEKINIFVTSRHPINSNIKILEEGDQFQTSTLRSLDRLPDKTSWIELSGLKLDIIPSYAFFRFGNTLRSLEFRNCIINKIEPNAFAGLYKLERLSFVDNNLPRIETNWFRDLVNLHRLIIAKNDIEHIHEYTFWHLRNNLKYLDIRDNRLRCLPIEEIERLMKLERLNAIGNPWNCNCRKNLEKILLKMKVGFEISVGRCYEDENQISSIIEERHRNQTNVITSSVTGNVHWASFEDSLNENTNVSVLIPVTTTMATTQEKITQQPTTELVHPSNIITTLQPTIHKGTCTLDNNSQQEYICTGLTSINPVNSIDIRAQTIRIILSDISVIPPESFQRFNGYLRRLEFRDCGIDKIAAGAFAGLYNLEHLSLHNNALKSFTSDYLVGLSSNLKHLDLSRNRILRIDNDVFDLFPHLISLDISDNTMNCIGVEHMEHRLTYLKSFEVTGNPWSCLCGIKLAEFLERRNLPYDKNTLIDRSECYGTREPSSTVSPSTPSLTTMPTLIITTTTEEEIPSTIEGVCTYHRKDNDELRYVCTGGNILLFNTIPNEVTAIEFHEGRLPRLPAGTLSRFVNLRELLIRNSGLRIIEPKSFDDRNELKVLAIQDNPLTTVDGSWLNLNKLERLDLRGNSIRYIAPQSFRHLSKLQYLNLEGNDLKCIFTSDLNEMPEVYIIEFSGNPLKWKCRLELEQFLEMRKIKFVRIEESCEGKKYMRNVLWQNKTDIYYNDECQACSSASKIKFSLMLPTFVIFFTKIY
ncbi:slit homolog 1 protein-like [Vespula pensylvanica]|uniref:slit homolog 1 protein-like n=1 Tax=Vespula pensylvanica TaxID=30213 RepID=UPI001CBA43C3|nr:slit homolog 1 protein-like [Vespula pensylvanica]XP_043663431.1 slit homolog 1 protein-like [Vespula pensylvanica]